MDDANWIVGLMKHNTDELGFIPSTTIEQYYVKKHKYILQTNEHGKPVGYLLHGTMQQGKSTVISQHCIELDSRLRGYGQKAFFVFLDRCRYAGVSAIFLRVGEDLPAVDFWQSCGFEILRVVPGGSRRNRMIIEMVLRLDLPMFRIGL